MYSDKEKLTTANITDIMQTAYIDYSMSVIVSRALPDARDGLKPVQRRILYAMMREGLVHNRPFDKCAGVVGEVLKNYHPHGDSSVYDTLVRLAQNWVMRYQLIEPQGNFGSVDGDPPAAYRYTECRLSEISSELLADIDLIRPLALPAWPMRHAWHLFILRIDVSTRLTGHLRQRRTAREQHWRATGHGFQQTVGQALHTGAEHIQI